MRSFRPLLVLFALSGCAALIYEIVWFQLLQLVIGSSAISLGLVLVAYMGGLCLGSIVASRNKFSQVHPLRLYGLLELGIGACGLLVLIAVPWLGRLYAANSMPGGWGILFRGI